VISCGMWDKLWRRESQKYQEELSLFFETLNARNSSGTPLPLIIWIELTMTKNSSLFGKEKIEFLKEETAPEWREKAKRALMNFTGQSIIVPTVALTKERISRDGVHYDMHTYQAIIATVLRGVPPSSMKAKRSL